MVVVRKRSIITDVNAALPLHICKESACLPVPKSAGEEGRQPEKCGVCTSPSDKQSLSAVARRVIKQPVGETALCGCLSIDLTLVIILIFHVFKTIFKKNLNMWASVRVTG